MNKKKVFFILCICLIYNTTVNTFYRPYIYSNKINDFGLADIGNNITFIPAVYFLYFLLKNQFIFSKYKDIVFHFCILITVEIMSAFIPHIGTFDIKDIFGLLFGTLILYFFVANEK